MCVCVCVCIPARACCDDGYGILVDEGLDGRDEKVPMPLPAALPASTGYANNVDVQDTLPMDTQARIDGHEAAQAAYEGDPSLVCQSEQGQCGFWVGVIVATQFCRSCGVPLCVRSVELIFVVHS